MDAISVGGVPACRTRLRAASRGIVVLVCALAAVGTARATSAVRLTGWWSNPTPNNASLHDGRTGFTVSRQGETGAEGDWPRFTASRWMMTNGSYGYGCARLIAEIDGDRVVRIARAASLPLRRCRASPALRKAEPSIK